MKKILWLLILSCFMEEVSSSVQAATMAEYNLADANAKKQVVFESQAPAEYIEGTAEGLMGAIAFDPTKPNLGLACLISVQVARMQTGNDLRDQHMRSDSWLNAERYPGIRFEVKSVPAQAIAKKADGVWVAKVDGLFTLKDISKTITVPVTINQKQNKL